MNVPLKLYTIDVHVHTYFIDVPVFSECSSTLAESYLTLQKASINYITL